MSAQSAVERLVPKKTFTVEFLVGMFAIAGLAAFAYVAVNIAGMKILQSGYYRVIAEFDNISGLKLGAPVEIAGVQIGQVEEIDLKSTNALVTLTIEDNVTLRADDIASIRTKGIIGDKYVKISPGASSDNIVAGGQIQDTESTVDLEDVIGKLIHRME